jgi:hypothetical protein
MAYKAEAAVRPLNVASLEALRLSMVAEIENPTVRNRVALRLSSEFPQPLCDRIVELTVEASPYMDAVRVRVMFRNKIRARFWEKNAGDPAVKAKLALAAGANDREKPQPIIDID